MSWIPVMSSCYEYPVFVTINVAENSTEKKSWNAVMNCSDWHESLLAQLHHQQLHLEIYKFNLNVMFNFSWNITVVKQNKIKNV